MAASVVWLTVAVIITATPGRFSTLAATGGFTATLDSDFLLVTETFNCADAGFAWTAGAALTVFIDRGFEPDFNVGLAIILDALLAVALLDVVLLSAALLTAALAVETDTFLIDAATALAGAAARDFAGLSVFAESFAGVTVFFITFTLDRHK